MGRRQGIARARTGYPFNLFHAVSDALRQRCVDGPGGHDGQNGCGVFGKLGLALGRRRLSLRAMALLCRERGVAQGDMLVSPLTS